MTASLRALLTGAIDYAGLFPPASLELEPALQSHALYVRSAESWMLGAFILPVAQFDAIGSHVTQFSGEYPLRVSALGPKTKKRDEFLNALAGATKALRNLISRYEDVVAVTQLEMPLPPESDAALLRDARAICGELPAFWEAPPAEAERTIALLADHNAAASERPFGFKLRTGGVVTSAFPESQQIATALVASAKHHVPIKFTAGLHHPVRQFHASVQTKMHGFLNVLGAGVMAAEHTWDVERTAQMLEDEDAGSFVFGEEEFRWRDASVGANQIRARRELVTSFGSCSFDEPRDDLRALGLL